MLLVFVVAVLLVYAMRFRSASRPQRRALTAVAATSLLFLPAYFIFNFAASVLFLDQNTLDTLSWGLVVARVLLPLGFLVALLQSRHFATTALQTLLEKLAARPTFDQWRGMVAAALDDDALRLGYHDPRAGRFRESGGGELDPPAPPGRAWVPVERDGQPVAAMVIDESLTEDPELVRAASTATLIAVENGSLEGELRASRARIVEAGHAERRRIERDLHDGAQQHLAGLSIEIALARELAKEDPEVVARLDVLGHGLEDALGELRDLAHGIYPPVLRDFGLKAALAAAARRCIHRPRRSSPMGSAATRPTSRRPSTSAAWKDSRTPASMPAPTPIPRYSSPGTMMSCALRSSTTGSAATSSRLDPREPASRTCANGSPSSAAP